ncbi:MAG TPA: phosphoribosylglycinamide synthetase C domain-containing protein, partial [Gemmatimonadales bacterium]|nr:phosphoribosylglycinamide synthetase C domain-containing protein [Gemmatimonadales bacterium]
FTGVLYAGLMIDPAGVPWVVEFNCRFGDPEAQVILPLISDGLTDCLWRVAKGELPSRMDTTRAAAVTTVLAARGYPEHPEKGAAITLPERLPEGVTIFHAGTQQSGDGVLRVEGGRVLTVTAIATSFREAQQLSRDTAGAIEFDGKLFRADIGWREAARLDERRPATVRRG